MRAGCLTGVQPTDELRVLAELLRGDGVLVEPRRQGPVRVLQPGGAVVRRGHEQELSHRGPRVERFLNHLPRREAGHAVRHDVNPGRLHSEQCVGPQPLGDRAAQ